MPKTLCFDLDGTLCSNTFGDYESAEPVPWAIARVNALALAGHRIVILTARGSATGIDWRTRTSAQLERWGVQYDELVLGKPSADVYIDDRGVHAAAWRAADAFDPPGFSEDGAAVLPSVPATPVSCVAEAGRTFGGVPLRLEAHVRRLHALADAAGVWRHEEPAVLMARVRDALAERRPAADEDLAYTITLADRPLAGPAAIAVRPLAEVMGELPLETGTWPLLRAADGTLHDGLGGELAVVCGGTLRLQRTAGPPSVAGSWLRSLAAGQGLSMEEAPVTAGELTGADEVLLVGMPYCLVGEGSCAARLLEAWSAEARVDLAAQTGALVRGVEVVPA